jgi:hypothetical protein
MTRACSTSVSYNLHCYVGCIPSTWDADPAPYNALGNSIGVLIIDRECNTCAQPKPKAWTQ